MVKLLRGTALLHAMTWTTEQFGCNTVVKYLIVLISTMESGSNLP